ncbi:hypothetical protein GKC30_05000 [Pseudodesulfovibrio sp. F-1]|uniref:Uncharacterized protein n=1 Tax=Pseudodesulfovibrio alkaliphilus TaxID=2661613 RepID=A0A7K1KLN2_9BACT|nr:hypothetical protein [Pseudodesulfovibrio alkaliphilus]MUM76988.1 hypothetical protein [Pseudodesulfovibrio alkaliphilus]
MQKQDVERFITFLEERAAQVRELERQGEAVLAAQGQLAFQAKAEEKAELLASLSADAAKYTRQLDGEEGVQVARRLEQFSTSASTALRIGSVFFMTALLYPEDHKPGEPNDLEAFIAELKRKMEG